MLRRKKKEKKTFVSVRNWSENVLAENKCQSLICNDRRNPLQDSISFRIHQKFEMTMQRLCVIASGLSAHFGTHRQWLLSRSLNIHPSLRLRVEMYGLSLFWKVIHTRKKWFGDSPKAIAGWVLCLSRCFIILIEVLSSHKLKRYLSFDSEKR